MCDHWDIDTSTSTGLCLHGVTQPGAEPEPAEQGSAQCRIVDTRTGIVLSGDEAMFEAAERDGSSLDPSPWRLVWAPVVSGRSPGVMNENILASVQCPVSSVQRYQDSTAIHYIQHHHCTHCPGVRGCPYIT